MLFWVTAMVKNVVLLAYFDLALWLNMKKWMF